MSTVVTIIGAGLAGTEAAWQLANSDSDISVRLYEMRPVRKTPAHHTDRLAELVCSNSLGSESLTTARGLLIHEMETFDSLIIEAAKFAKVPAGQALAVDRDKFADYISEQINQHPRITLIREEILKIPDQGLVIIATGPLTSEKLALDIQRLLKIARPELDTSFLNFFDAASPIVNADSIDMSIAFKASRYGKGTDDYINCPFYSQEEFDSFYEALISAEQAPQKAFEIESQKKGLFFEACLPIEEIARRGKQTLCFGPLKPVGLRDPRQADKKAVAVVQLRQDNVVGSLYNIVGFQTNLKWGEQKRVFSMIPGLKDVEIVRYGVMHQNIYINSPAFLNADLTLKTDPRIAFAGQITGVEGYTESAATGIIVARSIAARSAGARAQALPLETMMGALANYISSEKIEKGKQDFQPMNSNWGLINFGLDKKLRRNKKLRNEKLVERALAKIKQHELCTL